MIPLPEHIQKVHMIGICGTGMGALAQMLQQQGYQVQGSDEKAYPPMSDVLASKGITVLEGFCADNLDPQPDVVIVGNVVRVTNPEFVAVARSTIPFVSMSDAMLRLFMKGRPRFALCGTHGKTTTTALTAYMMDALGLNPGYFIGGVPGNFDSTARSGGTSAPFILEGDEYDTALFDKRPKMLAYHPHYAVITSVEYDHADIYPTEESVFLQFELLAGQLPDTGALILCSNRPELKRVAEFAGNTPVQWYGSGLDESTAAEHYLYADSIVSTPEHTSFTLYKQGKCICDVTMPMWGEYNVHNVLAALIMVEHAGGDIVAAAALLPGFKGIKRRQEIRAVVSGITLIDDFAHHPTAIEVTLAGLSRRYPDRRIIAAFDPRTNTSRRSVFQERFVESFRHANRVYISSPEDMWKIPEDDRIDLPALIESLNEHQIAAAACETVDDIVQAIAGIVHSGDIVVGLSNGGFGGFYNKMTAALEKKQAIA